MLSSPTVPVALAVLAATLAVLVSGRPRPSLHPGRSEAAADGSDPGDPGADVRPFAARHRLVLSGVLGAGAWLFVGGGAGAVVGPVVGVVAAALAWRALATVESRAVVERRDRLRRDLPSAVDLVVAVLESGAAPGPAVGVAGEALGGPAGEELCAIRSRLDLGEDPARVWSSVAADPELGPLGRAFARATDTGASVAGAARRLATELRERRAGEVEARARAVSTKAAAPLGICFLPAFILLGIVPLVAGLLDTMSFWS